jgi:hypothetical protein
MVEDGERTGVNDLSREPSQRPSTQTLAFTPKFKATILSPSKDRAK